jgi:hypothetical protein
MPNQFVFWIVGLLNRLRDGTTFSEEAFEKKKRIIMAIGQKVLREVTETERERLWTLMRWALLSSILRLKGCPQANPKDH